VIRIPREQLFLGLFFVLFIGNAVFNHYVGAVYTSHAREVAERTAEGSADGDLPQLTETELGLGRLTFVTNLPLFVILGVIVRSDHPGMGFGYWLCLVVGSTYVPFFITMMVYFLVHAPRDPRHFPGADRAADEDDDD
jgi:hypothetical protein